MPYYKLSNKQKVICIDRETEKLVRLCVEKLIRSAYCLRRQNGRDKNLWETECYDDRLDEEQ